MPLTAEQRRQNLRKGRERKNAYGNPPPAPRVPAYKAEQQAKQKAHRTPEDVVMMLDRVVYARHRFGPHKDKEIRIKARDWDSMGVHEHQQYQVRYGTEENNYYQLGRKARKSGRTRVFRSL